MRLIPVPLAVRPGAHRPPRRRDRITLGPSARALLGLILLAATAPQGQALAADELFATRELMVRGRPIQVWPVEVSPGCRPGAYDLLVISVDGSPPEEGRHLTLFPCDPSGKTAPGEARRFQVSTRVVGVDVWNVDGAPGGELLLLERRGVRIAHPFESGPLEAGHLLEVPGGLPLPPRARLLSRIPVAADWHGDGTATALLPSLDGGYLLDLRSGKVEEIALPVIAGYRTWDPDMPGRVRKLMISEMHWPVMMVGDDDGDGRRDLFALSRWRILVFRGDEDGLATTPTRTLTLEPFSAKQEQRFEATDVTYFATDIDGDGRTDFILHRVSGGLMEGTSVTDIHLNKGGGAQVVGRPDAQLVTEKGFAGVEPMDLDGDGVRELVKTSVEFGIMQLVRLLLTRNAQVKVEVFRADPEAPGRFIRAWSQDISFRLNFGEGRVDGLLPSVEADWNGDGRRDLIYPDGEGRMAIKLGIPDEEGFAFGPRAGRQSIPLVAGRTRVADLNGDGLDDLIAYDERSNEGRVFALYNRGKLPGRRLSRPAHVKSAATAAIAD